MTKTAGCEDFETSKLPALSTNCLPTPEIDFKKINDKSKFFENNCKKICL